MFDVLFYYGIWLWGFLGICIGPEARRLEVNACEGKGDAFAGAFLCSSRHLLASSQPDSPWVEGGSGWNLMMPGYTALKTVSYLDFFVEHLSGFEHHIRTHVHADPLHPHAVRAVVQRGQKALDMCRSLTKSRERPADAQAVGLLSLWLGRGQQSHTHASNHIRLQHFLGTVCSSARLFRRVVVGACSDFPRGHLRGLTDAEFVRKAPLPFSVEVVSLPCERGPNLPARLLRYAQEQLRKGAWKEKYVWYTETDQVVHLCSNCSVQDLYEVLARRPDGYYLLPNRLEQVYNGSGRGQGRPVIPWDGEEFKVNNHCRGMPVA